MAQNYTNLNNNIKIYFDEIRKNSDLTIEDERYLFGRLSAGDESAVTEIFNKMAKMAVRLAKTYTGEPELLEDLIQEANMGILRAINDFDITKGFRFSSYAIHWMRAYVSKYLLDLGTVGITAGNPMLQRTINKIKDEFLRTHCREISQIELIYELESRGESVNDIDYLTNISATSIDNDDEEEDTSFERSELFNSKSSSVNGFEKECEMEDLKSKIMRKLSILDKRSQEFVLMNFGIGYDYPMTYEMIASRVSEVSKKKINSERVRQIVVSALEKMK